MAVKIDKTTTVVNVVICGETENQNGGIEKKRTNCFTEMRIMVKDGY